MAKQKTAPQPAIEKQEAPRDELAETLIENGFVPNHYILSLNGALTVPHTMELRAPWNLPSRLFGFPIEISRGKDQLSRIGLMHPQLADHPFVQQVEAALGIKIDPNGAPNDCGYSKVELGKWWHAVDLMTRGSWKDLMITRQFTTEDCIAGAVAHGLRYSTRIRTADAREVMHEIGSTEPTDRGAILAGFMKPSPCKQDSGKIDWPINCTMNMDSHAEAWGFVIAIEAGWFGYDRSGNLNWTNVGRGRCSSGDSQTFIEPTGQGAFAF